MTVIIAENTKDKIILSADSGIYQGMHKTHSKDHKNWSKLQQINGISICTTGVLSDFLNFLIFAECRKPESSSLIATQRYFVDFKKWLREQDLKFQDSNFFYSYKDKLYHHLSDATYEIIEGEFQCDGAGKFEAYTAMYLGKTARQAIDVASKINMYVSGDILQVVIDKNKL